MATLISACALSLRAADFYSEPLDTQPAGWTTAGQWAFGVPLGQGSAVAGQYYADPTAGCTGTNVYGVNLAGDYSTAIGGPYWLTTAPINCTGKTNVHLKFARRLNSDYPNYVHAVVAVSRDGTTWTEVFHNQSGVTIYDSAWQQLDYNISSVADNQAAVRIRWGYQVSSSGAWSRSGWNIDDIRLAGDSANAPPTDILLTNASVAENSPAATVGTLSAVDSTPGDTHTFTLQSDLSGNFEVAGTTLRLKAGVALNYEAVSSYSIQVKATDSAGGQFTKSFTIAVTNVNDAPVVDDQAFTVAENSANASSVGTIIATDVDAGDTRTFAVAGGTGATAFSVAAATGQITVANSAPLDFETNPSFTLNITVTDTGALADTAVVTVTLTNVNEPPIVDNQAFSVAENSANASIVGTIIATDVDAGDTRTFTVTGGTGATAFSVAAATGQITVADSAQLDFETTPSFTLNITVTDAGALTATAVVTITLTNVNEPPAIDTGRGSPVTVSMDEDGAPTAFALTLDASDPDADATITWSIATPASHGAASVSGTGTAKPIAYTPAANYNGPDSFVVQVADGNGGADTITVEVTIAPINDAPVATAQSIATTEDTPKAIILAGTDEEGDTLTYEILTQPTKGVLLGTAPNLTYVPNPNVNGGDSFTFKVHDGIQASGPATISISITPVNDAPVATAQSVTTPEDTAKAISLAGTDIEGDTLTCTVVTPPAKGVLSGAAPNLTYTPSSNANGSDAFVFKVNDGNLDSAPVTVSITVLPVNDPPTISGTPAATVNEDSAYSFTPTASDPDAGDTRTFAITNKPSWAAFSTTTGALSGIPGNEHVGTTNGIVIAVTDAGGLTASLPTFDLTVVPVNDAPVAQPDTYSTMYMQTLTATAAQGVLANDSDEDSPVITAVLVQAPAHGMISLNADGSFTYTPAAGFTDTDTFTYRARDQAGAQSAETTANVQVSSPKAYGMGDNEYGQLGFNDHLLPKQCQEWGDVVQVAAGYMHTLIVRADGSLWACGYNMNGQLGVGTTTDRYTPVRVLPSGVVQVAAGGTHTLIVKTDGSLWACGYNSSGQLGDGTTTQRTTPIRILSSGVSQVATGDSYSLIVKTDGSLWACGYNYYGQLGDGTTTNRTSPVQVLSSGVAQVAAGGAHTLIVKIDGSLWACGDNAYGQLGDGTVTRRTSPVQILSSGVARVAAGGAHTLIVKTDGSLWACGDNTYGQLGDGTTTQRNTPVQVLASGVSKVAARYYQTMVLKTDSSLWACGYNYYGQLGDGTVAQRNTPVQVLPSGVAQVAAGDYHTLIVKTDGSLVVCGYNCKGQLGDGATTRRTAPIQVPSSGAAQVAAGDYHTSIVKMDGSLWACGYNYYGQLGDGTTTNRYSPVQVLSSAVIQIAAGRYHTLMVKTDGSLWACGYNSSGQLGDGTTTQRNSPVQVLSSGVAQVAAGNHHTLILKTNGSLWACGNNNYGQLGDGTTTNRTAPVQILSSGVAQAAGGAYHTLIVKTDGSLWACGRNNYGQLGDGTTATRTTPVQILTSGVAQVAAGDDHTLILKADGSLWACGNNGSGRLGDGTTTNRYAPVQILPSGVAQVAAGGAYTLIVKTDGSLWACGYNASGQLGDGTTTTRYSPVQVFASGVQGIACSYSHSIVLTAFECNFPPTAIAKTVLTTEDIATRIWLPADDAERVTLAYTIVNAPQHGMLAGTGFDRVYTPETNWSGTDSFTFTVADDKGAVSAPATVTITVEPVNDPPVIAEGDAVSPTMDEDGVPTPFAITLHAADADNPVLTWSVATPASHGTASASGTGAAKVISYTPAANWSGADSFVVRVDDGNGAADSITVSVAVNPVNDPPVIAEGDAMTVIMDRGGAPAPVLITLHATDVESSVLTWSIAAPAGHGTASVSGTGSPKSVSYTPQANYNGADSFVVQVDDGNGGSDTITVNTRSNNAAPTANADAYTFSSNAVLSVAAPGVLGNDTDPDAGEQLQAVLTTGPAKGLVTLNADGSFTYTPRPNCVGVDTFTYAATDTAAATAMATVTIAIPDTDGDGLPDWWESVYFAGSASPDADPDGDGLTGIQELAAGTNPNDRDTDHDGVGDGWELQHGLDPAAPDSLQAIVNAATDGETVVLYPGVYSVCVSIEGKSVSLESTAPEDLAVVAATVLQGDDATPVLSLRNTGAHECRLRGVTVTHGGQGGVVCENATVEVSHCAITGNAGGGIRLHQVQATLKRCVIDGNRHASGTAGIEVFASKMVLEDCVIAGNLGSDGGGLTASGSAILLKNVTLADNKAIQSGAAGMLVRDSCDFVVCSSILWGNRGNVGGSPDTVQLDCLVPETTHGEISFSDIEGGFLGARTGTAWTWDLKYRNLTVDPNFASPGLWDVHGTPADGSDDVWAGGDYHLKSQEGRYDRSSGQWIADAVTSPAIDAGDPAAAYDREPTPNGARVNMGAYGNTPEASKGATAIVVSPRTVAVPEGETVGVNVSLGKQPAQETVTVQATLMAETDPDIRIQSASLLTFTAQNWNVLQQVIVGAQVDGDATNGTGSLVLSSAGFPEVQVPLTELDRENPTNWPLLGAGMPNRIGTTRTLLSVSEGGTAALPVRLHAQPAADVVVAAAFLPGADPDIGLPASVSLTFTPANWNQWQFVAVSALDDADTANGEAVLQLTSPGLAPVNVAVREVDADNPGNPPVILGGYPPNGALVGTDGGAGGLQLTYIFADTGAGGVNTAGVHLRDVFGNDITSKALQTADATLHQNAIQWTVQNPADGPLAYTLVLADNEGHQVEYSLGFTIDAASPQTTASLLGGAYPGAISVSLAASELATIYYSTDGYPPVAGAANTAVFESLTPIQVARTTRLQYFAVDAAGNREPTQSQVYVIGSVPDAPQKPTAQVTGQTGAVLVQWLPVSPAPQAYRVYRALNAQDTRLLLGSRESGCPAPAALRIGEVAGGAALELNDSAVVPGVTYWYGVAYVAASDRESTLSPLAAVAVPASAPPANIQQSTERATAWLEAEQADEGSWGEDERTRLLCTAQVVRALKAVARDNAGSRQALFYLRGRRADNNRFLAEKMLALRAWGQDVTRYASALMAQASWGSNQIQGWGLRQPYKTAAVDTAVAMLALLPEHRNDLAGAEDSLRNRLTQTSGRDRYSWQTTWPRTGAPDDILVSALAGAALAKHGTPPAFYCWWVLDEQRPNGSLDNDAAATAEALLQLDWLDLRDGAVDAALGYLLGQQALNGSWQDDPYLTGLCLEALAKYSNRTAVTPAPCADTEASADAGDPGARAETVETPFAPELRELAASLHNDPRDIYAWVRQNIEFEDYDLSRKGALTTYFTGRGNEWDQCSLLIALLRISGIPAKYVYMNHADVVYVEAQVAEKYYKGFRQNGKPCWVQLVPWFKELHVTEGIDLFPSATIPAALNFDFDAYVSSMTSKTALELFEEKMQDYLTANHPGKSLKDVPTRCQTIATPCSLLPCILPNTHDFGLGYTWTRFNDIPAAQRSSVTVRIRKYQADGNGPVLIEHAIALPAVSGKRLCLDFTQVGGAYTPILHLNGTTVATGTSALAASESFTPDFVWSNGATETCPPEPVGTFMHISFDPLAASQQYIEDLKRELGDLNAADAFAASTRERYLGRIGAALAAVYELRDTVAVRRTQALLGITANMRDPSYVLLLYVTPDASQQLQMIADSEGNTPLGLVPAWHIDCRYTSGWWLYEHAGTYLPWDHPLAQLLWKLMGYSGSLNEGSIFDDLQNTPGLNAVRGLMVAHRDGIEVATLTKDAATGKIHLVSATRDVLLTQQQFQTELQAKPNPLKASTIASTIDDILNQNGTVIMPLQRVSYEGLSADVRIAHTSEHNSYLFDLDNGGASNTTPAPDPTITWAYWSNSLVLESLQRDLAEMRQQQLTDTSGAVQKEWPSIVARLIHTVGDPVDIVTGDFQCDELADLSVAAPGPDLELRRFYRNRLVYNGPFGHGWAWNHSECILPMQDGSLWFYDAQQRQSQIGWENSQYVYPPGATFRITKETNGSYTLVHKDQTTLRFDANGVLTEKRDTNGNTLTFGYNANYLPVSVTDTLGRTLALTYNAAGKVEKATAPGSQACFYVYGGSNLSGVKAQMSAQTGANLDAALIRAAGSGTAAAALPLLGAAEDLVAFVDVAGNVTAYSYVQNQENEHCNHNLAQYWLPNGDYLKLGYYKNDTVAWHQNAKGEVFNFQYSFLNRYAETWNEAGYYRKVFWNDNHDVTRVTTEDQALELMEYDANHNLTAKTDGNGNRTEFTYDTWRNVTSTTLFLENGDMATTTYTYTYHPAKPGLVTKVIVKNPEHQDEPTFPGVVLDFDANGNLLTRTDPPVDGVQHRLRHQYDSRGNVTVTVDEESVNGGAWTQLRRTDNAYAPAWPVLPATVTDTYNAVTSFTYDAIGNLLERETPSSIPGQSATTSFTYNAYGQITHVTNPLGNTVENRYDENRRLLTTTAPNGAVTANVYDVSRDIVSGAKLLEAIDPLGHTQRFTYDAVGNAVSKTDANGNTSTFRYDGLGRPIAATDALGNTTDFDYDANGNLTSTTSPRPLGEGQGEGARTVFAYDAANRKTSVTDALGNTATFEYDLNGNLIRTTTPDNVVTEIEYDALNRPVRTVQNASAASAADKRISTVTYDALGRKTRETGPDGHYTRWVYDATGALCTLAIGESDPDARRYTFTPAAAIPHNIVALRFEMAAEDSFKLLTQAVTEYDARGLVWRTRDGRGNDTTFTEFEYDAAGRKIAVSSFVSTGAPASSRALRTEHEYDAVGNLTTVRVKDSNDQRLAETRHRYNLRGERIATTQVFLDANGSEVAGNPPLPVGEGQGEGATRGFAYDANGNLTSVTDAEGNTSWTYYDALNRKIATADAEGNTTLFDYDENGNLVNIIDPLNNLASSEYDANNRVTKTIDATGNETQFTYDSMGRVLTKIRPDPAAIGPSIVTRYTYTAFGQIETVTEAEGTADEAVTTYTYTPGGQIASITDPRNNTVRFEYDGAGRKTAAIDADLTREEYAYDANDNLVLTTKRDGTLVRRTYDSLNRLTLVEVNPGAGYTTEQEFGYDALSRMTSASDRNGGATTHTVGFEYDSLSRLATETQDGYAVARTYDRRSQLTGLDYPGGAVVEFAYNTAGAVAGVDYTPYGAPTSSAAVFDYDAASRLTGATLGNGVTMTRTLNANGQEVSRAYTLGAANLASVALGTPADPVATAYDFRGNVAHLSATLSGLAAPVTKDFVYDALSRLTAETSTGVPASTYAHTWDHDLSGNWTATNQNGASEVRTANADNEYSAIDGFSVVYDANGNILEPDASTEYVYDWANRLVEVRQNAQTVATFQYDAVNRRVAKSAGSVTTRYVYSGPDIVEEYENGAPTPARTHVHVPGNVGAPLLTILANGAELWHLTDRQGSVLALANSTGAVVETRTYTAFGAMTAYDAVGTTLAASASAYGFTGQRWDAESALWDYRNRAYSPTLGRFLQRDPAGFVDGANLYAYCRNNPVLFTDPDGLIARRAGEAAFGLGKDILMLPYTIGTGAVQGYKDWRGENIGGVYLLTKDARGNVVETPLGDAGDNLATILADPRCEGVPEVWLNGQSNERDRSELLATEHTWFGKTERSVIVIHNPTHGLIADTFSTALEKFFGPSNVSKQTAEILSYRAERNIPTHFVVHSQGAVMGTSALRLLALDYGQHRWSNLKPEYHGSASNYYMARLSNALVGGQWQGMKNSSRDAVGIVLGLNSVNPLWIARSLLWAPSLGITSARDIQMDPNNPNFSNPHIFPSYRSQHTYYTPLPKPEPWWRLLTYPLY